MPGEALAGRRTEARRDWIVRHRARPALAGRPRRNFLPIWSGYGRDRSPGRSAPRRSSRAGLYAGRDCLQAERPSARIDAPLAHVIAARETRVRRSASRHDKDGETTMRPTRRSFLQTSVSTAAVATARPSVGGEDRRDLQHRLGEIAQAPVLHVDDTEKRLKINTMDLLRNGRHFLVRVTSSDGAVGIAVPNATHMIHLMQEYDYAFYEEPCRFDQFEDTKAVADALKIPVAAGEQEFSEYRFRWVIANRGVDIVQPDPHYYGGFIRAMRVARMAHAAGLLCTPHMSGSGPGYFDAAHLASCIPNPVPFTEFKGNADIPASSKTSSLNCENGKIVGPSGPGFGITFDPAFLREAVKVTTL
jgi:hypothetical protein